jgi:hypothetical protein
MRLLLALSFAFCSTSALKFEKHRASAVSLRHNQEDQSSEETTRNGEE